jgi:hypothetical protein
MRRMVGSSHRALVGFTPDHGFARRIHRHDGLSRPAGNGQQGLQQGLVLILSHFVVFYDLIHKCYIKVDFMSK